VAGYKKVDTANLDKIIKKTIEAINNSKAELFDIAEKRTGGVKAQDIRNYQKCGNP